MTKTKYLEIEEVLKDIGKSVNLTMVELDLFLWYIETGKILKRLKINHIYKDFLYLNIILLLDKKNDSKKIPSSFPSTR